MTDLQNSAWPLNDPPFTLTLYSFLRGIQQWLLRSDSLKALSQHQDREKVHTATTPLLHDEREMNPLEDVHHLPQT